MVLTTQQSGFVLGTAFVGLPANGLDRSENMGGETVAAVTSCSSTCFVPVAFLGNLSAR